MNFDPNVGLNRRAVLKGAAALGLAAGAGRGLALGARAQDAVNLQFWDMVWGPPEYIDTGKKLTEQFGQENPGIAVEYTSVPWNNWYQTFTTAIGSGTAPDISTGAGYQAVQFYDQGAVVAIDDVIEELESAGDLDDFLPGTIERMQYDGHSMALPWNIDIRVPFYRTDLFEAAGVEPPTNWEEFAEAAKALTKDGKYGLVSSGDTGGTHYMYVFMLNNGGGLFTEDRQVDLMNERNVEALNFLSDLVKAGAVHPASAGYVSDDAIKTFTQGDAAMIINNPGLRQRLPDDVKDKIGIIPPMTGPQGETGTVSWVNNIMLYAQGERPEETKQFLLWWSRNNLPLWTEGHMTQLPVRQSVADNAFFTDNADLSFVLAEYVPIGKSTGYRAEGIFPALNEVEGEGVMQTLVQDIWQGKDVQESMQKADERMRQIVGG